MSKALGTLCCILLLSFLVFPHRLNAAEVIQSGNCKVRLLTQDDVDEIPRKYRGVVVKIFSKHRQVIQEGLKRMTPLLCEAVQRVVFVNDLRYAAEDGWVLPEEADLVFINYDPLKPGFGAYPFVMAIQSFLHESTHAADFLLQANRAAVGLLDGFGEEDLFEKGESDADQWPVSANQLAKKIVENNRLAGGFRAEWVRVHRTFQSLKTAGDYKGAAAKDAKLAANALAKNGFMSDYGGSQPGEDIAEFASWMMAGSMFAQEWNGVAVPSNQKPEDYACQIMRVRTQPGVPSELAAVYTKANLLLSAGFVRQEDYDRCVGKMAIEGSGQGVFIYDMTKGQSNFMRAFTQGIKAEIGTHPQLEQYVFLLEASGQSSWMGKEYPATVKLRLPLGEASKKIEQISWPRGIYGLQVFGADFRVELPDVPAATFISLPVNPSKATTATLLISHASNERLEGSVFLQQALRPYAPVPVPQTGLPLRFTFKLIRSAQSAGGSN